MDTQGIIALDKLGRPIYVGTRVCWGVKGGLRVGSVVEHHHTYEGKVRKGDRELINYVRTTTVGEPANPSGAYPKGGVFRADQLIVIKD